MAATREEAVFVMETVGNRDLITCGYEYFGVVLDRMLKYTPKQETSPWLRAVTLFLRYLSNERAYSMPEPADPAFVLLKERLAKTYKCILPIIWMLGEKSKDKIVARAKQEATLNRGIVGRLEGYLEMDDFVEGREMIKGLIILFTSLALFFDTLVLEMGK